MLIRDRIGRFDTAEDCRAYLQSWLEGYCSRTSISNLAYLSVYPLKWAKIRVAESAHEPGSLKRILGIFVREQLGVSIKTVDAIESLVCTREVRPCRSGAHYFVSQGRPVTAAHQNHTVRNFPGCLSQQPVICGDSIPG